MRRLFVAVDVDEPTRCAVDELTRVLRRDPRMQRAGRTSWVRKEHMHLTLHFEADADERVESLLRNALANPIPLSPFGLGFQGLGFFPERGAPRVLWLGIGEGLGLLNAVHREIGQRLEPLNRRHEVFRPHLTLARFRDRVSRANLEEMATFPAEAGPSSIDRVTLYESRLSPKGPEHTALAEAPLKAMP